MRDDGGLSDLDYGRLLAFRAQLREFEAWSTEQATAHGLTASQHQLLLVVRGHTEPAGPTVGEIARSLMISHNAAVGLIDRTEGLGLVRRHRDGHDHRVVRLRLTAEGRSRIAELSSAHLEELARVAPMIDTLVDEFL